ncbi:hypothetical protein [Nonomuraea sp. NPDC050310]|uniref:hypothetical protein n=1 Tax=Nonomuraea sp. NPDC050310 TaxID=3154935 RepID=UPI0033D70720
MTDLFRDHLAGIAAEAPQVDLADRAVHRANRQRLTALAAAATAVLALTAGGVTLTVLDPGATQVMTSTITDTLPPSGVTPLSHAYYDFCGEQWDPKTNTATFDRTCAQWNVVTRDGAVYRMPEALGVYTEQSSENYMNTGAPVAITPDGRRIAYYSEPARRFVARDLDSGRIWPVSEEITRAALVAGGTRLLFSPDGRHLAVSGALYEVETGRRTDLPSGWFAESVPAGGSPLVVRDADDRIGLLADGQVRVLFKPEHWFMAGPLSEDGRTLTGLTGRVPTSRHLTEDGEVPYDTLVSIDTETGRVTRSVKLRGTDARFSPMRIGAWASPTEITVAVPDHDFSDRRDPADVKTPPLLGQHTYALDVTTGQVRRLASHTYRAWAGDLASAGF